MPAIFDILGIRQKHHYIIGLYANGRGHWAFYYTGPQSPKIGPVASENLNQIFTRTDGRTDRRIDRQTERHPSAFYDNFIKCVCRPKDDFKTRQVFYNSVPKVFKHQGRIEHWRL